MDERQYLALTVSRTPGESTGLWVAWAKGLADAYLSLALEHEDNTRNLGFELRQLTTERNNLREQVRILKAARQVFGEELFELGVNLEKLTRSRRKNIKNDLLDIAARLRGFNLRTQLMAMSAEVKAADNSGTA